MEDFLEESGMSEAQCENFMTCSHERRKRRFILQYAAASVIKLWNSVILEDKAVGERLKEHEEIPHKSHPAALPPECRSVVYNGGGGSLH